METTYTKAGVEVIGSLHDLTLIVPIPVGKHVAASSDGLYYTKKFIPLHS